MNVTERPAGDRKRFDGELLDVAGAAAMLGCSPKAIRARVARRCLPYHRFGARIVFSRAELRNFIEKLEGVGVGEALANATRAGERAAS